MLSVARALAMDPHLFLLDECFEGLSPAIIPQIANSIHEIAKMGHSILLSESNLYHVPDFTDKIYVIERGEIVFSGTPEELKKDKAILKIVAGAA
jgi:branched-chain amino acid transport system ATP-binding protein